MCFDFIKRVGEKDKMRGLPKILTIFYATSLINSIVNKHEYWILFSQDIKIT